MPLAHGPSHALSRAVPWLFVFTLALPWIARGQDVAVASSNLILRANPSAKARRIATVDAGDTVQLLARTSATGTSELPPHRETQDGRHLAVFDWSLRTMSRTATRQGSPTPSP